MNNWYRTQVVGNEFTIEFDAGPNRFWPPDVIRHNRLSVPPLNGRRVILTGPGAVWMYAHAAAICRTAGAREITVHTPTKPGFSNDLEGSKCQLIPARDSQTRGALFSMHFRPFPALSPHAIDELMRPRLAELSRLQPRELVISGRAGVDAYVRVATEGLDSGAEHIACWSARDGLVVIHDPDDRRLGCRISRPDWLAQVMPRPKYPIIIGVTGDPNLGKSVFSSALDRYRETVGVDGWRLDCDGQSPTPPWFLSLIGEERAQHLRNRVKRSWTPEMEESIAEQLRIGRELFSVLIADLPGGNHKITPPQRIPNGRERLFAEVDALILLDRDNIPSEPAWRDALRSHSLDDRIAAVLTSRNPEAAPSFTLTPDGRIRRGIVTGLDRKRAASKLADAFRDGLDQLWPAVCHFARSKSFDS